MQVFSLPANLNLGYLSLARVPPSLGTPASPPSLLPPPRLPGVPRDPPPYFPPFTRHLPPMPTLLREFPIGTHHPSVIFAASLPGKSSIRSTYTTHIPNTHTRAHTHTHTHTHTYCTLIIATAPSSAKVIHVPVERCVHHIPSPVSLFLQLLLPHYILSCRKISEKTTVHYTWLAMWRGIHILSSLCPPFLYVLLTRELQLSWQKVNL